MVINHVFPISRPVFTHGDRRRSGDRTARLATDRQRQKCYYRKRNYPISYKLRKLTLKLDQLMQAGRQRTKLIVISK